MALEVACPACGTKLRAPEDSVGKRVKCRKCEHRFVIPGDIPGEIIAEPIGESQMLSAIEPTPALPPPAAMPPAAMPSADPFSFEEPGGPVVSVGGRGKKPSARKSERTAKDDDGDAGESQRSRRNTPEKKSGGAKKVLLIVGGILGFLFLMCAGVFAAVWFFVIVPTVEKAKTLPTTASPPKDAKARIDDAVQAVGKQAQESKRKADANKGKDGPGAPEKAAPAAMKDESAAMPKAAAEPTVPLGTGALVAAKKLGFTIDVPFETLIDVCFGTGKSPTMAVLWGSDKGFQGSGGKESVDLYGDTGFRSARFEFPAVGQWPAGMKRHFAVSPSGKNVALERPMNRLTLLQPEAKKILVDAKDPFEGEAWANGRIRLLAFPGVDTHVVALENSGLGNAWTTADGKQVKSTVERKPIAFAAGERLPLFSHFDGNRGAAMLQNGKLSFVSLDPKNVGSIVSSIDVPAAWTNSAAFAADGRENTFVSIGGNGINTLTKTKKSNSFADPQGLGKLHAACFFNGDRLLALRTEAPEAVTIINLERPDQVFTVTAAGGGTPGSPRIYLDLGRNLIWFALRDQDSAKTQLIAVRPELDDAEKLFAGKPTNLRLAATPEGLKR